MKTRSTMSSLETLHYEMIPMRPSSKEYELTIGSVSSSSPLAVAARASRVKGSLESPKKTKRGFTSWVNRNFGKLALGLIALIVVLFGVIILLQAFYRPSYENSTYLPRTEDGFVTTFTSCGPVQGVSENGVISFKGIPYAKPPIEENRWKFAKSLDSLSSCWNETYLAHNSSKTCWQRLPNGTAFGDEDCLYLDIYTPRVLYDSPLPVVVIVSTEDMESDSIPVNPRLAAERNAVIVKVQFRLGVFGFLRAAVLSNRVYPRTSGNYGLSDIVTALVWVKHNIEHFGGEPSLVTILGYGAGATLAANLITYRDPRLGPLFTQVWLTGGTEPLLENRMEQGKINQEFLSKINCETVDCLLEKKPEELLRSYPEKWSKHRIDIFDKPQFSWLVVDGVYVKETVRNQLEKESFNDVATVVGANSQQHATLNMLRMLRWNNSLDVSSYIMERLRSINATDVWARYNGSETTNYFRAYTTMVSELRTVCPLYFFTRELADHFHDKVYFYVSTMPKARLRETTGQYADISAILGTYVSVNSQDEKFVQNMQDVFYNFVWYGQMPSDQEMPGKYYLIDDNIQTTSKYPSCVNFRGMGLYPKYARSD